MQCDESDAIFNGIDVIAKLAINALKIGQCALKLQLGYLNGLKIL